MSIPTIVQSIVNDMDLAKETITGSIHPLLPSSQENNHLVSYLTMRVDDLGIILRRLGQDDDRYVGLSAREDRLMPVVKPRRQFSQKLQKVMNEQHALTAAMRLDYESLFIYGNLALDHWARIIGSLNGVAIGDFAKLYHILNKPDRPPELDTVFISHNRDIVWLYFNLRHHRNKFIEHLDRPMQGGSSRPRNSHGFSLFTPAASGSISDKQMRSYHSELLAIGGDLLNGVPADHWQRTRLLGTLQLIMRNIDLITNFESLMRVGDIWRVMGGETVSYEVLARRLTNLLSSNVSTLKEGRV